MKLVLLKVQILDNQAKTGESIFTRDNCKPFSFRNYLGTTNDQLHNVTISGFRLLT